VPRDLTTTPDPDREDTSRMDPLDHTGYETTEQFDETTAGEPIVPAPRTPLDTNRAGSGRGAFVVDAPADPETDPETDSAADSEADAGTDSGTDPRADDRGPGAPVIPFHRPAADRGTAASAEEFAVDLDPEPQPGGAAVDRPVPNLPARVTDRERRPVIPEQWAGIEQAKATAKDLLRHLGHISAYHAVRCPWYLLKTAGYSLIGAGRLLRRQLRWWWVTEQHILRQKAAEADDPMTWLRLHNEVKRTRAWRGIVVAAEALGIGFGAPIAWSIAPWWLLAAAVAGSIAGLARIGRPVDASIVSSAIVAGRHRRLTADVVLRAYYAAGLGNPDKEALRIGFGSVMSRDVSDTGSQVVIDLPYGKGFTDVLKAKGAIASGLDVTINQVFLTPDETSNRRHQLFVADRDPLAIPAGRTPMLDCKPRSIWDPAPFGLDERGRKVSLSLMWTSVLVGAQPRKGKTFSARLLALYAALDPYVRLIVVDGKNSPDWDKFRLVAHRIVFGDFPNARDNDPVTHLLETLREVKAHIQQVNEKLSTLPVAECPEGKLTPELSRKYPELRVWMLVMEEFQVYYELDDQETNKEVASLLSFIMAVGPSAGVILLSSSQKPSGVGAGDVQRLFNRYRDNHGVRFALKCGNRVVSEAVLGGDAYAEGFDASSLPNGDRYRGVGILYGATDDTPITRTHLADHGDAEKILVAARKHRIAANTLSGAAAGEEITRDLRDVLADAREMFNPGDKGLHWEELAERLNERIPEHYAGTTPEAISAQLRGLRLRSVNVKRQGDTLKGCRLSDIDALIAARPSQ
jgi:S-DNA-T family DNA segregation ATPase FtsK/SpoIIIE